MLCVFLLVIKSKNLGEKEKRLTQEHQPFVPPRRTEPTHNF